MSSRRALLAAACLLVALAGWWFFRPPAPAGGSARPAPPSPPDSATEAATPGAVRRPPPAPERSTLADALNSPRTDIRADLRLVLDIVSTFRSNFLQTGNPVGSNAEITSALTGRNSLHLALIPPDHPAINRNGELCDRWGTPFFFHAESATRMEIRSAGPDRKMWNEDDVVITP